MPPPVKADRGLRYVLDTPQTASLGVPPSEDESTRRNRIFPLYVKKLCWEAADKVSVWTRAVLLKKADECFRWRVSGDV